MQHLNQGLWTQALAENLRNVGRIDGVEIRGIPSLLPGSCWSSEHLVMPGKALNAPWDSPKCKPIFCKPQEGLKRHIFLSGNVRLWQGQDSFLLCSHHFTPQLVGTLPQELSEMALPALWQEICTTNQQLMWWKPIILSKMVFFEWLTRQLKWV